MKKIFTLMAVCLLALVSGCGGQQSSAPEPADKGPVELHVSAAASLTDVMNEIGKAYEQEHPDVKVVFNYGSSGALQQAIENGGAADLFFSAAQKQMDALDKQGLLADGTREELLQNEVVLIVPKEGGRGITSFDALTGDAVAHVALGEPKGVPVGQYSEEERCVFHYFTSKPYFAKRSLFLSFETKARKSFAVSRCFVSLRTAAG